MLRIFLICIFASSCHDQEVVREHVRNKFLRNHNIVRELNSEPYLQWSDGLTASAHQMALGLSVSCFTNTRSGESSNILQAWGSRTLSPGQVVAAWMSEQTREKIIDPKTKTLGCSYVPCRDPGSFATSVIYVCHYGDK